MSYSELCEADSRGSDFIWSFRGPKCEVGCKTFYEQRCLSSEVALCGLFIMHPCGHDRIAGAGSSRMHHRVRCSSDRRDWRTPYMRRFHLRAGRLCRAFHGFALPSYCRRSRQARVAGPKRIPPPITTQIPRRLPFVKAKTIGSYRTATGSANKCLSGSVGVMLAPA